MSAEKHLNPSDFSDEQIDRMAFAIIGKLSKYGVVMGPMDTKEAIRFSRRGETTFYRWVALGIIKQYRPDPDGDPVYFPDQIVEGIKEACKSRK